MDVFHRVISLLSSLGFIVKAEKCSAAPTHQLVFLGAVINTVQMSIALPEKKLQRIVNSCHELIRKQETSSGELSALLGRMSHAAQTGLWAAPLHYRSLQRLQAQTLHHVGWKQKTKIQLSCPAQIDLEWWLSPTLHSFNKQDIAPPPFDLTIRTDASLQGWGATCNGTATGGRWGTWEAEQHINCLELKAGFLALQSFLGLMSTAPRHILLEMDNTTAVAYINRRGGTHSPSLSLQALEIWSLLLSKGSWVTARHLPGVLNVEADTASREFNTRTEWTLNNRVFREITHRYYVPEIDLFASRLNHQVPNYVSRHPDPGAVVVDAFRMDWSHWKSFIHPPVVLLSRVLQKVRNDRATALLVAPDWPGQSWYPEILLMLSGAPFQLPRERSLLSLPFEPGAVHLLWRSLNPTVWPISGDPTEQQASQQK